MSSPIDRKNNDGKPNMMARRKARKFAMQALYQWQVAESTITDIEAEFLTDNDMKLVDVEYFRDVLHGAPKHKTELDEKIQPHLDRKISEVTPVEMAILRVAAYEMVHRIDVPYKVVINEAVEMAKKFGATDGHKFINGVLDKLAQKERIIEIKNS